MLAAILAFGLSALSAFIGIGTIIAGILNGLFYRPDASDAGTSWLLARLTHALSVNRFLKAATALIWVTSLTLGLLGAKQAYDESVKNALEAKKITIEGLVLTAGGDPADNAVVTLALSRRQEVVTAPGGKFTFSKIDFSDEPSKTVRIQARWRTHEGEISADLASGPAQGLIIRLPPGDPPFRVFYFTLEGYAIDFLLHNKMNAQWEEKLGGQPFIVPNDVSTTLTDLIKRFSDESEALVEVEVENKDKKTYNAELKEPFNEKLFTGSGEGGALYMPDPTALIRSLEDPRQSWRVLYSKDAEGTAVESLVFRKFISPGDLDLCENSSFKSFYKYITRDYMPPDFGYANVYFESGVDCGEDEAGIRYVGTYFVGRSLSLRIAVVENISKDAISLDSFTVKVNRAERLRSRKEDKATLESQPAEKQDLFPQKMLNPGEKIVIPTELPLSYKKDEDYRSSSAVPISSKNRGRIVSELQQIDQINFPIYERGSAFTVSARTVENILNRPGLDFSLNTEYLYGPSVSIESVEIDKVSYPFRQLDPAKIVIRNGEGGIGSCPYVYTYSQDGAAWLNEGVILYGLNSKRKEKTVEKQLTRFDGRVLIKEKDPEDSFIDAAYVKAVFPDGRELILYPQNRMLRAADGDYLKLRQGEEVIIDFATPQNFTATKYLLGMIGYYTPYPAASRPPLYGQRLSPRQKLTP